MEDLTYPPSPTGTSFNSPAGTPYRFVVNLNADAGNAPITRQFIVTAQEAPLGLTPEGVYHLAGNTHQDYLNFFGKLAADYGLRLPQNHRAQKTNYASKVAYQEILRENLDAGMHYGYGDPAVLRVTDPADPANTLYYVLSTSNDAPDSFPIICSPNLTDWQFVGYVFPAGKKPAWAADGEFVSDYWAPEMHQVGKEFRVYFVARDKHTRELCIGLAIAAQPEGPFIPASEPILKGNVIDPHVYVQHDQTTYLYWKEDNNDVWPGLLLNLLYEQPHLIATLFAAPADQATASFLVTIWPWARTLLPMERFLVLQSLIEAVISVYPAFYKTLTTLATNQTPDVKDKISAVQQFMKTPMYAQPLSPDGTHLVGERTQIIQNDLNWEAHLVEGMWVTKQNAKYYLFYAGNDFSTDQYGIGVAIADAPLGPYRKMEKPLLQSTAEWWAPGHPSLVTDPNGKPLLFLHAYFPGKAGYKKFRALLAVPLHFTDEGVYLS